MLQPGLRCRFIATRGLRVLRPPCSRAGGRMGLYKHDTSLQPPCQDNLSALIHELTFKITAGKAVFNKSAADRPAWQIRPPRNGLRRWCFNPYPPLQAGATGWLVDRHRIVLRFNPRPPLQAGATSKSFGEGFLLGSFNPRPHWQAGATCVPGRKIVCQLRGFQSSPAFAGGARHEDATHQDSEVSMFQSSPAFSRGRDIRMRAI